MRSPHRLRSGQECYRSGSGARPHNRRLICALTRCVLSVLILTSLAGNASCNPANSTQDALAPFGTAGLPALHPTAAVPPDSRQLEKLGHSFDDVRNVALKLEAETLALHQLHREQRRRQRLELAKQRAQMMYEQMKQTSQNDRPLAISSASSLLNTTTVLIPQRLQTNWTTASVIPRGHQPEFQTGIHGLDLHGSSTGHEDNTLNKDPTSLTTRLEANLTRFIDSGGSRRAHPPSDQKSEAGGRTSPDLELTPDSIAKRLAELEAQRIHIRRVYEAAMADAERIHKETQAMEQQRRGEIERLEALERQKRTELGNLTEQIKQLNIEEVRQRYEYERQKLELEQRQLRERCTAMRDACVNGQPDRLCNSCVCIGNWSGRNCDVCGLACPPTFLSNADCTNCVCPDGYTVISNTCVDINECDPSHSRCDPNVSCINRPGGYTCGPCPYGYWGSGYGKCFNPQFVVSMALTTLAMMASLFLYYWSVRRTSQDGKSDSPTTLGRSINSAREFGPSATPTTSPIFNSRGLVVTTRFATSTPSPTPQLFTRTLHSSANRRSSLSQ